MIKVKHTGMHLVLDGSAGIQQTSDVDHGMRLYHRFSYVCGQIMVKESRTGLCQEKLSFAQPAQDMDISVIVAKVTSDGSLLLEQTT